LEGKKTFECHPTVEQVYQHIINTIEHE